jgi:hypothetical protein
VKFKRMLAFWYLDTCATGASRNRTTISGPFTFEKHIARHARLARPSGSSFAVNMRPRGAVKFETRSHGHTLSVQAVSLHRKSHI